MIKTKSEIRVTTYKNQKGGTQMLFSHLGDFEGICPDIRLFVKVSLKPGEEVEYHIHEGESESYYIISGRGIYNDGGIEREIEAGTATFTPSGCSHGIKNIGTEPLEFIALILGD